MTIQQINPLVIFFASILTSNMILSNFLGMCSYLSVSSEFKTASGLGKAVTLVMVFTTAINYLVYRYVIVPLDLVYLQYIIFIMVIAALVQIIEMVMDRFLIGHFPAPDHCQLRHPRYHIVHGDPPVQLRPVDFLRDWQRYRLVAGDHCPGGDPGENGQDQTAPRAGRPGDFLYHHRYHGPGFYRIFRHIHHFLKSAQPIGHIQ